MSQSKPLRLYVGRKYPVPTQEGTTTYGKLLNATVAEGERSIYGTYQLDDGQKIIVATPMEDAEMQAYRREKDSFFVDPSERGN